MVVVVEEENKDDPSIVRVDYTSTDVNGAPTSEAASRRNTAVGVLRNSNRDLCVDKGLALGRDSCSLRTVEVVSCSVWGTACRNAGG